MRTLYAIRDRVAQDIVGMQMYSVFVFRTDAQAVRYFADAVLDETSFMNKHPEDYDLVKLATMKDDGTVLMLGAVVIQNQTFYTENIPELIMSGEALIASRSNAPTLVKEA